MPTGPYTALCVRETGSKKDKWVKETTVAFNKLVVERWVSLAALNIAEVGQNTDVEDLCNFAAIAPKDRNARPLPVHKAALLLYMSKVRVDVCSRAIPGSNVPPTRTITSLQLHCCCPLLLDGLDFALQIVHAYFPLPRQRPKRLYVAELAAYTDRCVARADALQRPEAKAKAAARQQAVAAAAR